MSDPCPGALGPFDGAKGVLKDTESLVRDMVSMTDAALAERFGEESVGVVVGLCKARLVTSSSSRFVLSLAFKNAGGLARDPASPFIMRSLTVSDGQREVVRLWLRKVPGWLSDMTGLSLASDNCGGGANTDRSIYSRLSVEGETATLLVSDLRGATFSPSSSPSE